MKMKVRDLHLTDQKYKRAGFLPVVKQNGYTFYGFGIGSWTATIDDFGGTRESSDKDVLDTALREYREESLNIFGELTRDYALNLECFANGMMFLALLPIPGPFIKYSRKLNDLIFNDPEHESQALVWFSREQLLEVLDLDEFKIDGFIPYLMYWKILTILRENREEI